MTLPHPTLAICPMTVAVTMTTAAAPTQQHNSNEKLTENDYGNWTHLSLSGKECHQHVKPMDVLVASTDNIIPRSREKL